LIKAMELSPQSTDALSLLGYAALRDGNAAELASVSDEFERMGDMVAAVDSGSTRDLDTP
jgi:hypothetical protein